MGPRQANLVLGAVLNGRNCLTLTTSQRTLKVELASQVYRSQARWMSGDQESPTPTHACTVAEVTGNAHHIVMVSKKRPGSEVRDVAKDRSCSAHVVSAS